MKSKHILPIIILTTSFTLAACGHEHQFSDATCTEPKICVECQETEGEPIAHNFSEPTCETPATCTSCGLTDGEPLEHEWEEANYDDPKTCKTCGVTDGEPLPLPEGSDPTIERAKLDMKKFYEEGMISKEVYEDAIAILEGKKKSVTQEIIESMQVQPGLSEEDLANIAEINERSKKYLEEHSTDGAGSQKMYVDEYGQGDYSGLEGIYIR